MSELSHLEIFRQALEKIGVSFLEEQINGCTYIVMVNPNDVPRRVNLIQDRFLEFDETGSLSSY